jgi:hypothetical protein
MVTSVTFYKFYQTYFKNKTADVCLSPKYELNRENVMDKT